MTSSKFATTIIMLASIAAAAPTLKEKYETSLEKLNPVLRQPMGHDNKYGPTDFLATRFANLFFDKFNGIEGIFEARANGEDSGPLPFDPQWIRQGESDDPVTRQVKQTFGRYREFGAASSDCKTATPDVMLSMETGFKDDVKTFFAQLTRHIQMTILDRTIPNRKFDPAKPHKVPKVTDHEGANEKILETLKPFISCLDARHAKEADNYKEFANMLQHYQQQALDEIGDYARTLENVVALLRDLPAQYALALETYLLRYSASKSYEVTFLQWDYKVLTTGYFYLLYRLGLDKLPEPGRFTLAAVSKEIARIYSDTLAFRSEEHGPKGANLEYFVLAGYGRALNALMVESPRLALRNLKMFWTAVTGKGRGAKQHSRPEVAQALEAYLVANLKPDLDDRLLTMGHEVITYASESTDELSTSWLEAYVELMQLKSPINGLLPIRAGAVSKLLLFNVVPKVNHASVEINNQVWAIATAFFATNPNFDADPQSFPYQFDQFLNQLYAENSHLVNAIYPLLKIFNLWAANAERLLPYISFNGYRDAEISAWFNNIKNMVHFEPLKKFVIDLARNDEVEAEKKSWESVTAVYHLLDKHITWRQAVDFDREHAELLNTGDHGLGSGMRILI